MKSLTDEKARIFTLQDGYIARIDGWVLFIAWNNRKQAIKTSE